MQLWAGEWVLGGFGGSVQVMGEWSMGQWMVSAMQDGQRQGNLGLLAIVTIFDLILVMCC